MSTLITIAFYHLFFFVLLILSKKQKLKDDYLLLSWLMVLIIHFSGFYAAAHLLPYHEFVVELSGACVFLHGPILLSYLINICKISNEKIKFHYHYFPTILNCLLIPFLVINDNNSLSLLLGGLKISSGFCYSFLIIKRIHEYTAQKKHTISELEAKKIKWFEILVKGFLLITSTGMISLFLSELKLMQIAMNGELFVIIFLAALIFILGYIGLRQTSIFIEHKMIPTTANHLESESPFIKYKSTGLKSEHSENKYKNVLRFMEEHKPYLDPQITLLKLAKLLEIPPNQLSQIINQNADQNFFSFINSFRISEVINSVQNGLHKKETLLSIALSAGFNSKSSFNRAFKKITKQTPSAYIKQIETQNIN